MSNTALHDLYPQLSATPLFSGISAADLSGLSPCLSPTVRAFKRGEAIMSAGDPATAVGTVLSGSVQVVKEDLHGHRSILAVVGPGRQFGEAYVCAGVQKLPVSVIAAADTTVLMVDYRKIVTTCSSACVFHHQLIENMISILARNNIALAEKHEVLSKRTTRDKLVTYLEGQAAIAGSPTFTIPFSRQELADYLGVDRSALWREMSALEAEGVIEYHRNSFRIKKVARPHKGKRAMT